MDEYLLNEIEDNYCNEPGIVAPEFQALAEKIMQDYKLNQPTHFEECLELYYMLIRVLDQYFMN